MKNEYASGEAGYEGLRFRGLLSRRSSSKGANAAMSANLARIISTTVGNIRP